MHSFKLQSVFGRESFTEEHRQKLLKNGLIFSKDGYGNSLLHIIALSLHRFPTMNTYAAKFLIDNGLDVNEKNHIDRTALHFAVNNFVYSKHYHYDNIDFIRLLIDSGADVNAVDLYGKTPLHKAALGRDPMFIEILLKNGAHKDAKDIYGKTPLDCAKISKKRINQKKLEEFIWQTNDAIQAFE